MPQMTSDFVETVPLSHRYRNYIPFAATQFHVLGNRPALGKPPVERIGGCAVRVKAGLIVMRRSGLSDCQGLMVGSVSGIPGHLAEADATQ